MNLSRLLVPIAPDQSINQLFHQAFKSANQRSSHVTLLTVIEELAELKEIAHYSSKTLDALNRATTAYQDTLKQHVQSLSKQYPNIQFHTHIRIGIPFIEILKEAKDSNASMIVIDSHREEKDKACQRGSSTLNLMRKSEVPIWSLSLDSTNVNHIVAAIDLTNQDDDEFNARIVALGIEFCSVAGAELTLCHAWRLESEGFLRKWNGYDDLDIALLSEKMRSERIERLNSLLMPHASSPIVQHVKLLEGEPRDILPSYIADNDIDLVILGSLSRTGVAGFLMGNTAESMVNKLNCSVLTLKPDSFKSPVFGR
ncbi:universal stress protein [Photobacterium minamisatsumaniensis]|uniref:universal stress protein n=1 Tax=Photobacterium minamisatsumaniensis TaxID=2910233 RepID=UPI003D0A3379